MLDACHNTQMVYRHIKTTYSIHLASISFVVEGSPYISILF